MSGGDGLVVNEIFRSIQGEGARAGRVCAFVRLTGCNLRCRWCDTPYAYDEGGQVPVESLLEKVAALRCRLVMLTGGEPLLQPATPALLARLCDAGYEVLLETNGSLDVSGVDARVVRCVDIKCPGSGEAGSFLWSNLDALRPGDEIKLVLADREDYDYARRVVREHDLTARCTVLMVPAAGLLPPVKLAEWILGEPDALGGVRLGLQLHKIIWPDVRRGV